MPGRTTHDPKHGKPDHTSENRRTPRPMPQQESASLDIGQENAPLDKTLMPGGMAAASMMFFQQAGGNKMVQRLLAEQTTPLVQRENGDAKAEEEKKAEIVYRYTHTYKSYAYSTAALDMIAGMSKSQVNSFMSTYYRLYGIDLVQEAYSFKYLASQDSLIKALAVMFFGHALGYETSLALALIPEGTRDLQLFQILTGIPLAARKQAEERYNTAFGKLGLGSLKADLRDDLVGGLEFGNAEWYKALALLHREKLTPAEEVYLKTTAIGGTKESEVVQIFQDEWLKGPDNFEQFKKDWANYVNNQQGWVSGQTWDNMDLGLTDSMDAEFSGENWRMIKAILDGATTYEMDFTDSPAAQMARQMAEIMGSPRPEMKGEDSKKLAIENIQLEVAEDSLKAAMYGGGTNEEQVFKWLSVIEGIWKDRIKRVEGTYLEETFRNSWENNKKYYLSLVATDIKKGSDDYKHAQMLLAGNLNAADEMYAAIQENDSAKFTQKVIKFWAENKIPDIYQQAKTPKVLDDGTVVRPAYDFFYKMLGVTGYADKNIVLPLTNTDYSQAGQGAFYLHLTLDEHAGETQVKQVYDFLNHSELKDKEELRNQVVELYANRYLGHVVPDLQGESNPAKAKMITYIFDRFPDSVTKFDILNLVSPATTAKEMLDRAKRQYAMSQSGVLNVVLDAGVAIAGELTAEDYGDVVMESMARLEQFVYQNKITGSELKLLMKAFNVDSVDKMATMEFDQFKQALDSYRAAQQTVTDTIITGLKLLSAVFIPTNALSVAASFVIEEMLKAALLGKQYDKSAGEHLAGFAQTMISHGLGKLGEHVGKSMTTVWNVQSDTVFTSGILKNAYWNEVLKEGISTTTTKGAEAILNQKMPELEDVAISALGIFAKAGATQIKGDLKDAESPEYNALSYGEKFARTFETEVTGYVMTEWPNYLLETMKKDTVSPEEFMEGVALLSFKAVVNNLSSAAAEVKSEKNKAAEDEKQAALEKQQQEEREAFEAANKKRKQQ